MPIRRMVRRDMPQVLEIENADFEFPWTEENFLKTLRQRNAIGMVMDAEEDDTKVLGFLIYELHKARLHLLNLAVHPNHRRSKVGTHLLSSLTTDALGL